MAIINKHNLYTLYNKHLIKLKEGYKMREWQVGDPVGDGNDIGVPDTKYMGYLKDNESYREDIVDDFKFRINHARDAYNLKNMKVHSIISILLIAFTTK